jgi:BlaI family penicillinase repressor
MPNPIPKISDAEWVIMKELWRVQPQTAGQIAEALAGRTSWSLNTIKTLINRLVTKRALAFVKQGREHLYHPVVTEATCVRAESSSFLSRVFDGALRPMLASFLESEELSPEDIAELKRLLAKKEGEQHASL